MDGPTEEAVLEQGADEEEPAQHHEAKNEAQVAYAGSHHTSREEMGLFICGVWRGWRRAWWPMCDDQKKVCLINDFESFFEEYGNVLNKIAVFQTRHSKTTTTIKNHPILSTAISSFITHPRLLWMNESKFIGSAFVLFFARHVRVGSQLPAIPQLSSP